MRTVRFIVAVGALAVLPGTAYREATQIELVVTTDIPEPTTAISPSNARSLPGGWASSGRLWIWGGSDKDIGSATPNALGDGMSYDLGTQQWAQMPTAGAPAARPVTTSWRARVRPAPAS